MLRDRTPAVTDSDTLQARITALEHELAALHRTHAVLALGFSHDVRAPLRAIESFSWLLEQRFDALDDTARDHLRRIREASARLQHLIARLQTWMHVGEAPMTVGDVDLSMLADWCVGELRDAQPQREADIDIAEGLRVRGDERLLKTALQELLHNAWIFSAPDARVHIRIEGERNDGQLALRVRDHGIGFDPALATKLGEPFQRLHRERFPEGSGLGLAIARRIAQRHGGDLHLEGRAGEGAIASLVLPVAEAA
jgi:light-regulated signal transduction histidine kinase (bacteriophytochrome)